MTISKAQQKAVAKYTKENYDEIKLRVPKGDKDKYKSMADKAGKSLNQFIIDCVEDKIDSTK